MTLAFVLELALTVLLAATLVYCIVLERRLAAVRKGQEGLKRMIGELNAAISGAGASLRALKGGCRECRGNAGRTSQARPAALADELALLTASGERIAERFDRTPAPKTAQRSSIFRRAASCIASTH